MRIVRLTDGQAGRFFIYVAELLKGQVLPIESKDHALVGEWKGFREFHIAGDTLVIYISDESKVCLARMGSHSQLFNM